MVELLSNYPAPVLERSVSPSRGLAAAVSYPNIAKFKALLDQWRDEFYSDRDRRAPVFQKRLPEPLLRQRPQGYLAQVFVPQGHPRYEVLCKRAEASDPIWWKYGKSSDNRSGIWVSHNFWNSLPDVQGAKQ